VEIEDRNDCLNYENDNDDVVFHKLEDRIGRECAKKFTNNIVVYIAGWIGYKITKSMHCDQCEMMLKSRDDDKCTPEALTLFNLKKRGHLFEPAKSLVDICYLCEKLISITLKNESKCLFKKRNNFSSEIEAKILTTVKDADLFHGMFHNDALHMQNLLKLIIQQYIRLKKFTFFIRQKLTRLMNF
jgi:hypothetical protein